MFRQGKGTEGNSCRNFYCVLSWPVIEPQVHPRSTLQSSMMMIDMYAVNFIKPQSIIEITFQPWQASEWQIDHWRAWTQVCSLLWHCVLIHFLYVFVGFEFFELVEEVHPDCHLSMTVHVPVWAAHDIWHYSCHGSIHDYDVNTATQIPLTAISI